jgi:hypothetical protein
LELKKGMATRKCQQMQREKPQHVPVVYVEETKERAALQGHYHSTPDKHHREFCDFSLNHLVKARWTS